ncbi:MAG: hypothetical protein EU531_11610 [Promethearchaeota archaeon]|nr:MAG: hypothetical protein EU531_11610 [Candidatus Lokiarchaeota archaeon]
MGKYRGGELDFKNLTDENLIYKLNYDLRRKDPFNFLEKVGIYEVKLEKELKSLVKKDEDRTVLLKNILDYCEKEWIPE